MTDDHRTSHEENRTPHKVDRRTFLKYAALAGAGATVGLGPLGCASEAAVPPDRRRVGVATLEMYRSELRATRGDSQGCSPHCVNCKGNCAWQTYELGGRIVREEQVAAYPQIAPNIPDANPRGCNKGALHSQALYESERLLYPLKRVGGRGEGKWRRISWKQALSEIAGKVVDAVGQGQFDRLMIYAGTGILAPVRRAASLRLGALLGSVRFNVASAVGDMFPGATITYGLSTLGCTSEAWYEADYVLIWGMNPSVSRIPDAHYLWEGKYRGTRVVTVTPEYNATARQSSLWIPVNPGTDSFLAMSMVHVILKEGLYDKDFIREQTDLPFLVKTNDWTFLRQSDLVKGGNRQIFYLFDEESGTVVEAPGSMGSREPTLRLGGIRAALEGVFEARTAEGEKIPVTTVFELVRREAEKFSPEAAEGKTGVHPSIVREEARRFARAKVAVVLLGYRIHKYFWGSLAARGASLLLALTGHAGRRGGLDIDNEWGLGDLGTLSSPKPARMGSGFLGEWLDGSMQASFLSHYDDAELRRKAGLGKEELLSLVDKAVKEEGFPYFGKPRVMMLFHDNKFVRNSDQMRSEASALEGVDLYVNVNYRMDSSAALADIVLPAITNYEGWEMRLDPGYARFASMMVPPEGLKVPGEAKPEWEICLLLAREIQRIARKRGIPALEDPAFQDSVTNKNIVRDLKTLYGDYVNVGTKKVVRITDEKQLLEWTMAQVPAVAGWDLPKARSAGFITLAKAAGQTSPLYPDMPFYPLEPQVYMKQPYATVTGRQQFYVDHPLYLKLGCAVPTGREPVRPGRFPLAYFNPHTRYGIHSTWRTGKYHLRLQRGVPHLCINPETAAGRGIADGDRVRVFNDVGETFFQAKLHPGTPQGAVWSEHAWENFQFPGWKGVNNVVAGLLTPLELAGNHDHLVWSPFWDGNQLKGETSVQVGKA